MLDLLMIGAKASVLIGTGRTSWSDLCRLMSADPTRVLGLYLCKELLQEDSDAGFVVFGPGYKDVADASADGREDFTLYEGMVVKGRAVKTLVRGAPGLCRWKGGSRRNRLGQVAEASLC
jgi:dihydroorotase-like cyclic amidohydrolase